MKKLIITISIMATMLVASIVLLIINTVKIKKLEEYRATNVSMWDSQIVLNDSQNDINKMIYQILGE